jgi:hypothetical protein
MQDILRPRKMGVNSYIFYSITSASPSRATDLRNIEVFWNFPMKIVA